MKILGTILLLSFSAAAQTNRPARTPSMRSQPLLAMSWQWFIDGPRGYVTNTSGKTLMGASVDFAIYNYKGEKIRERGASTGRLEPREVWHFDISAIPGHAARLLEVSARTEAGWTNVYTAPVTK